MYPSLVALATADVPLTPENVRPGWTAMLVVFLLLGALALLGRSLSKHTRKAREPWPGEEGDEDPTPDDSVS